MEQQLVQADPDGKRRRAAKATKGGNGKPKAPAGAKLGDWTIPRPLSPEQLTKARQKLGEAWAERERIEDEIEDTKLRARNAIKRKTEQIAALAEKAAPIAHSCRTGIEDRETRCWRLIDGEDVVYIDPATGEELYRHTAGPGEQQGLWGGTPTGARTGWQDERRLALVLELLGRPWPEDEPWDVLDREMRWPWCDWSWHPFVLARQVESRAALGTPYLSPSYQLADCPDCDTKRGTMACVDEGDCVYTQGVGYSSGSGVHTDGAGNVHTLEPVSLANAAAAAGKALAKVGEPFGGNVPPPPPQAGPLKWRKVPKVPKWVAGEYSIDGTVHGWLRLKYAMVELGRVEAHPKKPTRSELQAAKARCQRHADGSGESLPAPPLVGGTLTTTGADSALSWCPAPGDEQQLFSTCGVYQVRHERHGWIALCGEDQLDDGAGELQWDELGEAQAVCERHAGGAQ